MTVTHEAFNDTELLRVRDEARDPSAKIPFVRRLLATLDKEKQENQDLRVMLQALLGIVLHDGGTVGLRTLILADIERFAMQNPPSQGTQEKWSEYVATVLQGG